MNKITNALENLNSMQKKAIVTNHVPLAIIAGAGSGKTRTITHKIAYLIDSLEVKPWRILAVTFTNKAAKELKERIQALVGDEGQKVYALTYHALCAKILRQEIQHFGIKNDFTILDTLDQRQILSSIYRDLGLQVKGHPYNGVLEQISIFKNFQISPSSAINNAKNEDEQLIAEIYQKYVNLTKQMQALDFDDLINYVHELFKTNELVSQKWASKFDYVLVDEFQDTSLVQYEIITKIAKPESLTIVGDPDQTIYTWRFADASLINNFSHKFPNAEVVKLEQNYRSSQQILDLANRLISHNTRRIDKNLFTVSKQISEVEFYHGFSDEDEARQIATKILQIKRERNAAKPNQSTAILYRANYLSAVIEKALIGENISYTLWGGIKFYQREEIKDTIAYLKVIHNV